MSEEWGDPSLPSPLLSVRQGRAAPSLLLCSPQTAASTSLWWLGWQGEGAGLSNAAHARPRAGSEGEGFVLVHHWAVTGWSELSSRSRIKGQG